MRALDHPMDYSVDNNTVVDSYKFDKLH